jgi:hypothetical protein
MMKSFHLVHRLDGSRLELLFDRRSHFGLSFWRASNAKRQSSESAAASCEFKRQRRIDSFSGLP